MAAPLLSKTRFQAGRQCLRRLWLDCHRRDAAEPYGPATLALFAAGAEVGALARGCFPGGRLVAAQPWEHDQAVTDTAALLQDPSILAVFEAGFIHDGVRLRSDVLARSAEGGWRLIEVKSSTQPKEEHFWDLGVQRHVLAGCGVEIESTGVMHINREYVYDGKRHDPYRLLSLTDGTAEVEAVLPGIPLLLSQQKDVVAKAEEPAIAPGLQCGSPYPCPFSSHCAPHPPKHWIAYLPGLKPEGFAELTAKGIEDISQIPDDFHLTATQRKVRDAIRRNEPWVSERVGEALAGLSPPLLCFDFETIGPAVPRYAGARPYQAIPFQWSLHIVEPDGRIAHREFLFDQQADPRRPVADAMLEALEREGVIVVYHAPFETGVIQRLAADLPDLAPRLLALLDRVVDLLVVVRESYYHPDLLGSYSLKRVVPALVPDADYGDLTIQEGTMASVTYLQMLAESDPQKRETLRRDLLAYCQRDTWATVRVWQELCRFADVQAGRT